MCVIVAGRTRRLKGRLPLMKKFVAIVLSLMLCLGAAAALATETEVKALNWADFEEAASAVEASFQKLDPLGLQIWIPNEFNFVEASDEEKQLGLQCAFAAEDGSAVAVSAYTLAEGAGLADYAATLEQNGATDGEYVVLNGLNAYTCVMTVEGVSSMAVAVDLNNGAVAQFTVGPVSDENGVTAAITIFASIQAIAQ